MPPRRKRDGRLYSLGLVAADWIEQHWVHGPGDVAGEPFILDDEEVSLLGAAYRIDATGRRVFSEVLYSRLKGRRKSDLAAAVVAFEAFGPCRFAGWAGDEPEGRPVSHPFVRVLATEEEQTGNTYDAVKSGIEVALDLRLPWTRGLSKTDVGLTRIIVPGGGEIVPSTASSAAKDGGRETFSVFDETHLYATPELRRMYATVRRNGTKRKIADPWFLQTSTMFAPGEDSVAERTHAAAAAGTTGLHVDHREGPEVEDLADTKALTASIRYAAGAAASWMDIRRMVRECQDPRTETVDAVRYYLNRPTTGTSTWLTRAEVEAIADPAADRPEWVTLGFDGARLNDSTALVACSIDTGHVWPLAVWECPPDEPGWEIPGVEVDEAVRDAMKTLDVWRLYADPPYWESYVDQWAGLWPDRVVRWHTWKPRPMAEAVRAFTTAVRAREVTHDGDSTLVRHLLNARKRPTKLRDPDGRLLFTIGKSESRSPHKIDAAVAAVLAWEARGDAIAAGALPSRRRGRRFATAGF